MPVSPDLPDVFQSLQRSSWGEFEGFWLCINRNACLDLNLEQMLWFYKCPKSMNSIISSAYLPVGTSTSEIIARMLVMKVATLCLRLQNTRQRIQPFICIFSRRPTLWGRSIRTCADPLGTQSVHLCVHQVGFSTQDPWKRVRLAATSVSKASSLNPSCILKNFLLWRPDFQAESGQKALLFPFPLNKKERKTPAPC